MKKLYTLLGIIAIGAVIGLTVFGCKKDADDDDGGGGGNTLVITGVPSSGISRIQIVIVPPGTAATESAIGAALVGGADSNNGNFSMSGDTLTVPLHTSSGGGWTDSGPFDVYRLVNTSTYTRVTNKTFTAGTTTVSWSDFTSVTVS